MSKLLTNTTDLQEVLQTLQNKATGTTLPELTNEGSASDLLNGEQLINGEGKVVVGTMPNNGTIASTMDGINTKSVTIPQGYTSGGIVSLDNTIDNEVNTQAVLISQIANALENKAVEVEYKEVEYSENEYAIINRTIRSYTNDIASSIGMYAFYSCTALTSVNFPACISINTCAFNNCCLLESINFPACTSIGSSAFTLCANLTSVSFPACTRISDYAFNNCYDLTSVSFPACTRIGSNAFSYCSRLTTASFPVCTSIGSSAFYSCTALTSVNFPACTSICSTAFRQCYNLSQFYLTGSSLCILQKSNAFSSTPYAGYSASFSGTPYIYVPTSLVSAYKSATNWVFFSSYFIGV